MPGLDEQLDAVSSEDEVFALLPGKRIQGAFLAHDSRAHWFFALLTAGLFFGYIRFAYPLGEARPLELVWIALFTATIGILLLLAFQYVTAFTQGVWLRGGGIAAVFFYIVKFIGFSYRCALDPSNGFLASFFGFTMGVGLCEELCKTLPILWHFRKSASLDWRGAIVWGFMSGAGFGISEAGHYSSDFYNGIATGGIYLVRFLSCVALHAVWSGTAALIVWRRQHEVQEVDEWWEWIVAILRILWIVMILHGLYDTLLKREFGVLALLIAIASFGYFAWEFERARKFQEEANTAIAAATPAE